MDLKRINIRKKFFIVFILIFIAISIYSIPVRINKSYEGLAINYQTNDILHKNVLIKLNAKLFKFNTLKGFQVQKLLNGLITLGDKSYYFSATSTRDKFADNKYIAHIELQVPSEIKGAAGTTHTLILNLSEDLNSILINHSHNLQDDKSVFLDIVAPSKNITDYKELNRILN